MTPSLRSAQKRKQQPIPQPLQESVPVLPEQFLTEAAELSYYNSTFMMSDPSSPYSLVQVSSVPYFRRATDEELSPWSPTLPPIQSSFMGDVAPIPVDPRLEGMTLAPQLNGRPVNPQMMPSNPQWGGLNSSGCENRDTSMNDTTPDRDTVPKLPSSTKAVGKSGRSDATGLLQPSVKPTVQPSVHPSNRRVHIYGTNKLSDGHKRAVQSILGLTLSNTHLNGEDNGFSSHCTSHQADIRLLDFEVSAVELMTYFPKHTFWYGVMERLSRAGWAAAAITKFINWSRAYPTHEYVRRGTIHCQGRSAKSWFAIHPFVPTAKPSEMTDRTGSSGGSWSIYTHDYYLVDLAEGVRQHPTGSDARCLTRAILHAQQYGGDKVKLSDAADYIREQNLSDYDYRPYDFEKEDKESAERMKPIIKAYEMNVLGGARN